MNNDLVIFLISATVFIIYLVFSALTEMGTKLPMKGNTSAALSVSQGKGSP